MSEQSGQELGTFGVMKSYPRFAEMCDYSRCIAVPFAAFLQPWEKRGDYDGTSPSDALARRVQPDLR
jgi:hypothetical protein